MKQRSKRYRAVTKNLPLDKVYSVEEAAALVKKCATAKFDETVDLAIKLAIDTKQADQLVRGSVSLPHGIGKTVRVVAICDGAEAEQSRKNGAVEVGAADLVDKILGGFADFDVVIAHPAMMKFVGKLGKVLGPKGLMPSPKSGTVTDKVATAVAEFAAGKIEFRNDKEGNMHLVVGKASFEEKKLAENIEAAVKHIASLRPASLKGDVFVTNIAVSATMGPGFRISINN
ncbi:MAG: 50S ribosomal protein L1 [Planctomycetota bacterium]|jgi:large subunit ribosomal protein L1|nr:50S ribosomal protein L1 [Planctomycetota bacterium]